MFHGFFLVVERGFFGRVLEKIWQPLRHGYTLVVVMISWVLFRAIDLGHSFDYLRVLFGMGTGDGLLYHTGLFINPGLPDNP